jgi:hypothetical protein
MLLQQLGRTAENQAPTIAHGARPLETAAHKRGVPMTFRSLSPVRHLAKRASVIATLVVASLAGVSAHVIRGVLHPTQVTGFVSSPSGGTDVPIAVAWGARTTGLRVACFFVANTSAPRSDAPDWPRVTAVGFALPGEARGFALMSPLDAGWELLEDVPVTIPAVGDTTIDFALVAPVNPMGHGKAPRGGELLGIPPGQPGGRGSGNRFCVSGPFPDDPAIATPTPLTIEQIINGVVLRFHGVGPHGPSIDLGIWENAISR